MKRIEVLTAFAFLVNAPLFAACPTGLSVGFQIVTFNSVKTAVWYPTTSPEVPFVYSPLASGSVAENAPPATCGAFPMVVFSHAYGGCPTQSVFITEQLARDGYVVAAPDHADAGCPILGGGYVKPPPPQEPLNQPGLWTDQTYLDRKNDMQSVITGMESSPVFGPMIDASRVAGMGHSLGGYTVLGLAGAWPSWKDTRIKQVLAFSPYAEPFRVQHLLGGVSVPVMYQGGTLDFPNTTSLLLPGGYDANPPPKFFAELNNASHLLWTNITCIVPNSVSKCLSTLPEAALIDRYGFAFLDYYIKGQSEPILWGNGFGLVDYRHTP